MNRLTIAEIENCCPVEHTQDANMNTRAAQFKRLTEYLDYCRQQHKTVTYLEVADAIDIPPPHRIHQLTLLLEALMDYDQKHNQPLRSALVVSRAREGLPAEGFFLKAQELGSMRTDIAQEFHQQCLTRLFDAPTPNG